MFGTRVAMLVVYFELQHVARVNAQSLIVNCDAAAIKLPDDWHLLNIVVLIGNLTGNCHLRKKRTGDPRYRG